MKTGSCIFLFGLLAFCHAMTAQNVADFFVDGQGSGIPDDPYIITTGDQLNAIRYGGENKCYKLNADIDLGKWIANNANEDIKENGWVSIDVFRQVFDGNGHKIIGYWQNRESDGGLFFQLQVENTEIPTLVKNLTIELDSEKGIQVTGQVGAIATKVNKESNTIPVRIENCHVVGNIFSSGSTVGGLIGRVEAPVEIDGCSFVGKVTGGERTGGLVGQKYEGKATFVMKNSFTVNAEITGSNRTGGLGGEIGPNSMIENCYASGGTVTASGSVGGLIGHWGSSANAGNCMVPSYVKRCFSSNSISGSGTIGGLVGEMRISGGEPDSGAADRAWAFDIIQSYSAGSIDNGESHIAGGVVGQFVGNKESVVEECYSIVPINSNPAIGGIVGDANECLGLTINNCFALNASFTSKEFYDTGAVLGKKGNGVVSITNCHVFDGLEQFADGLALLSKEEAARQVTYAGWDFGSTWTFGNEQYKLPVLAGLDNQPTLSPDHLYVEDGTTGADMVRCLPDFFVKDNTLTVKGSEGTIVVYDAKGVVLHVAQCKEELNLTLEHAGMYILHINGIAHKFMIK